MANTPRAGLPYPAGTDKTRFGYSNIQALAEAVDPGVTITVPLHPSLDAAAAYPYGVSLFIVALADAQADGGWPMLSSGFVTTVRLNSSYCYQIWARASTAAADVYWRPMLSAANGPWARIGGADYAAVNSSTTVNAGTGVWTTCNPGTIETQVGTAVTADSSGLAINVPGIYLLSGMVQWNSAATTPARRILGFGTHNDSSGANATWRSAIYAGDNAVYNQSYTEQVSIAAGDTGRMTLWVHQLSGAVLPLTTRRFVARRIG